MLNLLPWRGRWFHRRTLEPMLPTVAFAVALLALGTFVYASLRAAPWVPMWSSDVQRFLRLANVQAGQRVVDLGCGDGRVVAAAAGVGAQATGYEVSLVPFVLAQWRTRFGRRGRVRYHDLWTADLREADVVFVFLMQKIYPKLQAKLERELNIGAKVVTYVWGLPGWTPVRVDTAPGRPKLFLYRR